MTLPPKDSIYMKRINVLIKKCTAYNSLEELSKHNPTLRVSADASDEERKAMFRIRAAYTKVTGKIPEPKKGWNPKR